MADDFQKDDFEPEMTFAIVNGVRVPLGGDTSDIPDIPGLVEPGNVDLKAQPKVPNPIEGGMSTVYSKGFNLDGKEYLLPSVTPDGRFLSSDEDVVNEFKKSGKHLGIFKDQASSDAYGKRLHEEYESGKFDDFAPDDFEPEKPKELTRETPTALKWFERLQKPLVDVSPETRQHMAEFEQVHPVLGGIGRTALDMMLGESSPLGLGLGIAGAGESAASGMGMENLARALKIPSRVAGGGMVWHGLSNMGNADTLGGKAGGLLEAGLGGLAIRGPRTLERPNVTPEITPEVPQGDVFDTSAVKPRELEVPNAKIGTPPYNTSQFGLDLSGEDLPYPQNIIPNRLRAPSTNATVFDALLPDSLKLNEQGAALPPTTSLERRPIQPQVRELPKPITISEKTFYEKMKSQFKELIGGESGAAQYPDGRNRRPLKALDELHDALFEALGARTEQEDLYSAERAKRFSSVESVTTQGKKGMYERLGRLEGEMPKAEFQPVKINPDSARALYNEIQRANLSTPEKTRASTGLGKILGDYGNGEMPQMNEIEMLRRVFGDTLADQLVQLHSGIPITTAHINEMMNLSKSLMASTDMSAPFRQGLGLIHTKEFWKNYSKMFSFIGKNAYDVAMRSIKEDPMYPALKNAGLQITEIGKELGAREEAFASRIAEKIPGVPASERMYTGFLNKTRFDVAKRLMMEADKAGLKPMSTNSAGELIPSPLGKEIANFVNVSTGRGSLGRLEKNAVELNSLFFSPRLISSRLTMLNPAFYVKASPFVRKEALKSLFAIATAGKIVEEVGKAAGGTVETNDPTSSDYHKVRIGNTRIDPYGGFQQYITAASRLGAGTYNGVIGNKEGMQLKDALRRTIGIGERYPSFMENKLSPLIKFADDLLAQRPPEDSGVGSGLKMLNVPHSAMTSKIANQFTPMIVQDLLDIMQDDPSLIPLSILGANGMGIQTYQPNKQSGSFGR